MPGQPVPGQPVPGPSGEPGPPVGRTALTRPAWGATLVVGCLMAAAAGLHVSAMFPLYPGNPATPIVQAPYELAVYICLEAGWALAAGLVLSRWVPRAGVALGAGLGAVEVGLVAADLASGFQLSEGGDPGVWLALAGLAAGLAGVLYGAGTPCLSPSASLVSSPRPTSQAARSWVPGASATASSARAFGTASTAASASAPSPQAPGTASAAARARVLLSVVVAIVAVAAFWPSWDHYHVVSLTGQVRDLNLGNAFDQPAAVMAGELVAGLAIGLTVVVGALWRDAVAGAFALLGTVIALGSQVISGAVQVSEPLSQLLGSPATSGVNLAASSVSLTGYWYVDVAATGAMALLAIWQLTEARKARRPLPEGSSEPPRGAQDWHYQGGWPQRG